MWPSGRVSRACRGNLFREWDLFSGWPSMASVRQSVRGREPLKETPSSYEDFIFLSTENLKIQTGLVYLKPEEYN